MVSNGDHEDRGYFYIDREIRIVLLGKTGCGKSATGNTIFGCEKFQAKLSGSSVTHVCSQNSAIRFNKKIVIVDTPGIFDTSESNEKVQEEINKCIGITSPGPHAFILVLNITERFTEEEDRTVDHFVRHFGDDIFKYFIVLFTRKEELNASNTALKDHISSCPGKLQKFIQRCGNRVLAFENKLKGVEQDTQVKELLHIIEKNVTENGGKFYTNEMYITAERKIKAIEEERLRKVEEKIVEDFLTSIKETKDDVKEDRTVNTLRNMFERLNSREEENDPPYSSIEEIRKRKAESVKRKETQQNEYALHERRGEERKPGIDVNESTPRRESLQTCRLPGHHGEEIKRELEEKLRVEKGRVRDEIRSEIEHKRRSMSWTNCIIL